MRAMALLCELVNEKTLFCPSFVNTGNFIAVKELVSVIIMVMNGKKRIAIVAVALIAAAVVGLAALRVAGVWGTKPAVSVSDAEMVPAEPTSASAVSVPVDISSEMPEEPPAVEITEEAYETVATAAEEAEPAIMEIPSTALPVVVSLDGLVAEVGNESAVISYPADISDEDIQSIIAASDDKYGLSEAGVTYVVEEPGVMRVHYGGMSEEEAEEELQKLKLIKIITHTKEDVKNLLGEYLDGNIEDINYQRKIINKFVNSVYIFDDKIAIYYNLFNLRKFTYEEALENIGENEKFLFQNDCSAK